MIRSLPRIEKAATIGRSDNESRVRWDLRVRDCKGSDGFKENLVDEIEGNREGI